MSVREMETARRWWAWIVIRTIGHRNEKDIEGGFSASCADVAATRGDGNRLFIVIVDILRIVVR